MSFPPFFGAHILKKIIQMTLPPPTHPFQYPVIFFLKIKKKTENLGKRGEKLRILSKKIRFYILDIRNKKLGSTF